MPAGPTLIVVKEDVTKSDTVAMNNLVSTPFTSRLTHYSCSRVGGKVGCLSLSLPCGRIDKRRVNDGYL